MSNRWTRRIGVLLAFSILAFGVGRTAQARTAAHPSRALINVTLQLKWVPQAQFGGYYVALDKGFYRQAGLNVTIKPGGPQIAPAITASRALVKWRRTGNTTIAPRML